MLISKAEYAKQLGVSRQAIHDAVIKGVLDQIGEGRAARIDTECYKSIQYSKNSNCQRKGNAENLSKEIVKRKKLPPKIQKKEAIKQIKDDIVYEQEETVSITVPKKNGHDKEIEEILELAQRLELAKTEKMEQQAISEKLKNAARRGELIEKEVVYDGLIRYLDKINSNLERLADSFLSDMGGLIVDAGKVLPEHQTAWKDSVMGQIDDGKVMIAKQIKDIQRGQAL